MGIATAVAIPRPVPAGVVPFPRRGCRAAKGEVRCARPVAPGCPRVPAVWRGAGGSRTGTCPRAAVPGRAAWHRSCPALGATSLGRARVPKRSRGAVSRRAVKFGSTDLPLGYAMRNEIGAVSLEHPQGQGVGWCWNRGGGQRPTWGSWSACSTPGHTLGYVLADLPHATPAPTDTTPRANDAPAELGASGARGCRAKGPGRERGWRGGAHTVAFFFPCHSYMGGKKRKDLGKTPAQSYPCASEVWFVGQSHVRCYYKPQGAKSFLLPNLVAV